MSLCVLLFFDQETPTPTLCGPRENYSAQQKDCSKSFSGKTMFRNSVSKKKRKCEIRWSFTSSTTINARTVSVRRFTFINAPFPLFTSGGPVYVHPNPCLSQPVSISTPVNLYLNLYIYIHFYIYLCLHLYLIRDCPSSCIFILM